MTEISVTNYFNNFTSKNTIDKINLILRNISSCVMEDLNINIMSDIPIINNCIKQPICVNDNFRILLYPRIPFNININLLCPYVPFTAFNIDINLINNQTDLQFNQISPIKTYKILKDYQYRIINLLLLHYKKIIYKYKFK